MIRGLISAKTKLDIVDFAKASGNIRKAARKYSSSGLQVHSCQIRKWKEHGTMLKENLLENLKVFKLHSDFSGQHHIVGQQKYD